MVIALDPGCSEASSEDRDVDTCESRSAHQLNAPFREITRWPLVHRSPQMSNPRPSPVVVVFASQMQVTELEKVLDVLGTEGPACDALQVLPVCGWSSAVSSSSELEAEMASQEAELKEIRKDWTPRWQRFNRRSARHLRLPQLRFWSSRGKRTQIMHLEEVRTVQVHPFFSAVCECLILRIWAVSELCPGILLPSCVKLTHLVEQIQRNGWSSGKKTENHLAFWKESEWRTTCQLQSWCVAR